MTAKTKIIVSMIIFGTIPIFVKNISLSSGELALHRAIIATVTVLLYKFVFEKGIRFDNVKKVLPLLLLSGAVVGFNWILLFQAYKFTSVSKATLSYYFAPTLVIAASAILFKERLTVLKIICFVMATTGLTMVIGIDRAGVHNADLIGIAYGLGAASLYAVAVLMNKFIKSVNGIDKTVIQFAGAIIVLIPYVSLTSGMQVTGLSTLGLVNLLILGVIHTGITYCLYFASLKDLTGQQASILSYIDPLVAIVISVAFFGEAISLMQITGGIMILGFTLINELNLSPKEVVDRVLSKTMRAKKEY